jgi:hypothetical protein
MTAAARESHPFAKDFWERSLTIEEPDSAGPGGIEIKKVFLTLSEDAVQTPEIL